MSDIFLILLVLGVLGLAAGMLFGGALDKIVHSRKDCPLCWEAIPAESAVCPKCKAKL